MDNRYLEAVVNKQHVILGRKLHPYCLYDMLILTIAENPLVTRSRAIGLPDLRQAVIVCSTPYQRFLEARSPIGKVPLTWWRFVSRNPKTDEELAKFIAYLEDFSARPTFWEDDGGGGPGGLRAPWILKMAAFIECYSNMREEEVMTAPLGKMFWKSAALAELLGMSKSELQTEEEEAAMKEMGLPT
jgi:hypothetical protein